MFFHSNWNFWYYKYYIVCNIIYKFGLQLKENFRKFILTKHWFRIKINGENICVLLATNQLVHSDRSKTYILYTDLELIVTRRNCLWAHNVSKTMFSKKNISCKNCREGGGNKPLKLASFSVFWRYLIN